MWQSKPPAGIQLNITHPLAQGLVGCWLFNEGSGLRANDLSGNNNTGVLTNFEPFSSTSGWTGGNTGTALQFNGTNDFVNCGNNINISLSNKSFTIFMLAKRSTSGINNFLIGQGSVGAADKSLIVGYRGNNKFTFSFFADDLDTTLIYPDVEQWTNWLVSYNTETRIQIIYRNGIQIDSRIANANFSGDSNTNIGRSLTAGGNFNGIISDVRLWKDRVLSAQEVQQLYAQPYAMFWSPSERIRKNYDNEILV